MYKVSEKWRQKRIRSSVPFTYEKQQVMSPSAGSYVAVWWCKASPVPPYCFPSGSLALLLGCLHKFLDELASILRESKVFSALLLLVDLADQPPKSCPSRWLAILSIEEHLVGRAQPPTAAYGAPSGSYSQPLG